METSKLIQNKPSFKEFKEKSLITVYGKQNSNLYILLYDYSPETHYKYKIKLHGGNKLNSLRAAYYLLFGNTIEGEKSNVQIGEFKIPISYGGGHGFYAGYFDSEQLKYRMDDKQNNDITIT